MPFFSCTQVAIEAISCAVPSQRVEVKAFGSKFGHEAVAKFEQMTGVKEFRIAQPDQTAADLGFAAAESIVRNKGVERDSIGAIVFVSQYPDYRRPATACVLQKRLQLNKRTAAFDINLGCSGYVYGIYVLASMMQCSDIQNALLIVGETSSKLVSPEDKATSMLFGDAGSATLLSKRDGCAPLRGMFRTVGDGYRDIIVPAGGFRNLHASHEVLDWPDGSRKSLHHLHMNGKAVFEFTMLEVPELIQEFLSTTSLQVSDYDSIVLHQANHFILKQICRKFKISQEKLPISMDRYGNTSGVSIPLTICDAFAGNEKNLRLLMSGFGVGLSLGIIDAQIDPGCIGPIIESDCTFPEGKISSPADF